MRFHADAPLCDFERDLGRERLNILAEGISRGEYLGERPASGPIPKAAFTYKLDEADIAQCFIMSFVSDEELRCVHEHSLVRPALERRGYERVRTQAGRPAKPTDPVPWRRSEWRKEDGEVLTTDLIRKPEFSSLKLVRTFDTSRPFQRPKVGLEPLFF